MQVLLVQNCPDVLKALSKIVAKTWLDEEFNSKFLSNTNAALEENGITLPEGVEFTVHENTLLGTITSTDDGSGSNVVYEIPLPSKPEGLADENIPSWIDEYNAAIDISATYRACCV